MNSNDIVIIIIIIVVVVVVIVVVVIVVVVVVVIIIIIIIIRWAYRTQDQPRSKHFLLQTFGVAFIAGCMAYLPSCRGGWGLPVLLCMHPSSDTWRTRPDLGQIPELAHKDNIGIMILGNNNDTR